MKVRLIRLYPLYFVATLAGFLYAMVTFLHTGQIGVAKYLRDLVLSLLFIPTPRPADFPGIAAFPYNSFAWSIFYELVANLVHTTLLRRRSTRFLLIMAAAVGLPLCVTIVRLGADTYGTLTQDIPVGLLRVMFSYLVGMLLFRLWSRYRDRHMLSPFWSVLLLLTTISISVSPQHNAVFDILVLLLVLPNVVLLGVFSQPSGFVRPMATLLGVLSYGLYILSAPMMIYVSRAWDYLLKRPAASMTPWSGIAAIAILFLVAWLADAVYDLPLRRWLRKRYGA
jgi:peptidoglycan/LPS O-acetylase OafA/YrhL